MISDESLLQKIAKGDAKAFEVLFHRHKSAVFGLSYRLLGAKMLAEENSQETWIKVVENAESFQPTGSAFSWVMSITKNQALNTLRKRGWEENMDPETENNISANELDVLSTLEKFQDLTKLKKMIDELPDRQRVALVLWMYEEKSYSELAVEMGLDINAVKALLFRAKENVSQRLKEDS